MTPHICYQPHQHQHSLVTIQPKRPSVLRTWKRPATSPTDVKLNRRHPGICLSKKGLSIATLDPWSAIRASSTNCNAPSKSMALTSWLLQRHTCCSLDNVLGMNHFSSILAPHAERDMDFLYQKIFGALSLS